nr:MAG: ORF1 [TTV-like mini virus]
MPYWRYRRYPQRRRRIWRRRFRRPFFNRFWRKRRHRYRHRVRRRLKLPYLTLRQYQPPHINKLKIKGTVPLFITTSETISRDYTMYSYNTVPHLQPNGGGYSIITFNLGAFWQMFQKVLCIWTQSNNELPLIRYTGCQIKLYNSEHADYITNYHNCFPMTPNLDTFNSTHPTIMQLNNRHKIIPCRKNRRNPKPYKKLKLKPPSQMTKKWYFQNELCDTPLLMLMTASMSLDRYYQSSNSISTTIGFKSLNTDIFQSHNFKTNQTSGYQPKPGFYMWAISNGDKAIEEEFVIDLIFLGQTELYTQGKPIRQTKTNGKTWVQTFNDYTTSKTHWGNPFDPTYLEEHLTILLTQKSPHELLIKYTSSKEFNDQTKIGHGVFTEPTGNLIIDCRYNPLSDNGNNHIFLEPINKQDNHPWSQPTDPKLEGRSYPVWLSTWGFLDYQKDRLKESMDLDYVFIITSDYIHPRLGFFLPIDEDFLNGRSPYGEDNTKPTITDQKHWQPKVRFQTRTINTIASCGPGTIKLSPQTSAEAHADFIFYFKLGGCAPKTKTIENPKEQPVYPTPNNFFQQPSLQNPEYPATSFIYNFDQRRHYFTKKATERLSEIPSIKTTVSSITGGNRLHQETQKETSSESESETETQTLLQQLKHQYRKQHRFKQRILQLIQQLSSE